MATGLLSEIGMSVLSGFGLSVLGSALSGVPAVDPGSGARASRGSGAEVQMSYERAGVDDEGCVLYRVLREQEGQPLPARAGLVWQRETGGWARTRPVDCVRAEAEGRSSP